MGGARTAGGKPARDSALASLGGASPACHPEKTGAACAAVGVGAGPACAVGSLSAVGSRVHSCRCQQEESSFHTDRVSGTEVSLSCWPSAAALLPALV